MEKKNFKVLVFKNKKQASIKIAKDIKEIITKNPHSYIGLSTGNTMISVYDELSKITYDNKNIWNNIKTFNVDEFYPIAYSNPNSFHVFMEKNLFSKINIPKYNIHFPELINEKINYHSLLQNHNLNFLILGIGLNGHIAYNEPGSKLSDITRIVNLTKKTQQQINLDYKKAITMGIKEIISSNIIYLVAFGKSKRDIMLKFFNLKSYDSNCPSSALLKIKNLTVILDQEALPKNIDFLKNHIEFI